MLNRLVNHRSLVSAFKFNSIYHYQIRALSICSSRLQKSIEMTSTPAKNNIDIIERGARNTESYRIFYANTDSNVGISPWHDIAHIADAEKNTYHMVVEIPRWSNAKMEISTKDLMNPIKQDKKKGALRYVRNLFPFHGYPFNYGAIPQTWENPEILDEETGHKGDNDPLDAVEIGSKVHKRGAVIQIKILGCYALIDEGETDWKLIVVDVNDPLSEKLNDLKDIERLFPGLLSGIREWFRNYKVPDGKPKNTFAFDGEPKGRDFALKIVNHCHEQWKELINRERGENKSGLELRNTSNTDTPYKIENPKSLLGHVSAFSPGPSISVSEQYEIDKWHYVNP